LKGLTDGNIYNRILQRRLYRKVVKDRIIIYQKCILFKEALKTRGSTHGKSPWYMMSQVGQFDSYRGEGRRATIVTKRWLPDFYGVAITVQILHFDRVELFCI